MPHSQAFRKTSKLNADLATAQTKAQTLRHWMHQIAKETLALSLLLMAQLSLLLVASVLI